MREVLREGTKEESRQKQQDRSQVQEDNNPKQESRSRARQDRNMNHQITQGQQKIKQKMQLTTVLQTAWPAVFESFFISLAGMIDTLMVSGIGSEAVASVGLTTQPKFLGLAAFIAINVAVSAIVARRKGEQDRRRANETLAEAVILTVLLGIVISIACVFGADWIIRLCGSASDTHAGAVAYFQIIMGGMMFNIISMVINAAQRGVGNTKIAMYTNTISSAINILGNYVLIGGHLGFPKLGIRGAAIATVFGTVVGCIISICSLFRKEKFEKESLPQEASQNDPLPKKSLQNESLRKESLQNESIQNEPLPKEAFLNIVYIIHEKLWRRFRSVKIIFKLASSVFIEQVLLRIGFMSTAIMAADMGTSAMAAHQVGMNALSLSFSLGDGMQAAAVALIGRSLGEKNQQQAKKYGFLCQRVGIVMAVVTSLIYMLFGKMLYEIFFSEEHIVEMGVGITRCIMIIVLFQISQVIFTGCLRGAGDVVYTMISSCVSVTFVRTIAGYVFCYIFGWGIYGIWMGIIADQLCRLTFSSLRFISGKWMKIKI
jgi:Na+-driven multidrug efflux pump